MNYVANNLMPLKLINWLGSKFAKILRKYNKNRYVQICESDFAKEQFLKWVERISRKKICDYIILGHSHCKVDYLTENGVHYLNNGFPQYTQTFLWLNEKGECEFIPLERSN